MSELGSLRHHVVDMLVNGHAHLDAQTVLMQFPSEQRGRRPTRAPYSPWELLEHMRIVQWDILEFTLDADHISPKWPEECWPGSVAPPTGEAWDESVRRFLGDLDSMQRLVSDERIELLARIPHGDGQTYLREALLVADHNSYHLGELVLLRKILESESKAVEQPARGSKGG